jgi:hypothetical protein
MDKMFTEDFKNGPIIVAYVSLGSSFGYNAETRRLDIQGGCYPPFRNLLVIDQVLEGNID